MAAVSKETSALETSTSTANAGDSAEDALILQTEWVQPDPLGVLELGPDNEFQDSELVLTHDDVAEEHAVQEEFSGPYKPSAWRFVLPTLAVSAIIGWTAFFAASHWQSIIAGAPFAQWSAWISEWAIPVLLVAVAWMLALRNSHVEARRFGNTAAMLSHEARELENRLTVVNRELSLAREFLGSQSRELDSLGRIAADRISTHAGALEGLIKDNGTRLESIANVSDTALSNMAKLRDDLPVIANSAKDVSNQVGNAGLKAEEQLGKLVSGFERLNEFGSASERQVASFNDRIGATLDNFDAQLARLNDAANARFSALNERSDGFRKEMLETESKALAAMRDRADHLRRDVETMRETLASEEAKSLATMRTHIATLRSDAESMSNKLREDETATLAGLSQAKERFFAEMAEVVAKVDALDQQAVGSAQERVKALHAEASEFDERLRLRDAHFTQEVAKRQDALKAREADAIESLANRLSDLDASLAERAEAQEERSARLAQQSAQIAGQVEALNALFANIASSAAGAERGLVQSLEGVKAHAAQGEEHIAKTGKAVSDLTDASMRLMEIIEASTTRTRDEFPKAVSKAVEALQPVEDCTIMLSASMEETVSRAERLSKYVEATQGELDSAGSAIEGLRSTLSMHSQGMLEQVSALRDSLRALDADGAKLTERTSRDLSGAIAGLQSSVQSAFSAIESGANGRLDAIASDLSTGAAKAVETALTERLDEVLSRIEARAQSATGASKEAAEQLRAQLDEVNTLAGNLELRVAKAREQASEDTGADFTRRTALLMESLNSHAIDITGALSSEVTDTAWAAYLKGDRGIFTRRAVRLLDSGQARQIAGLYQNDEDFRAHVNRFVHDFEAMLSTMLATPDGNALSVAMLGADVGKLYVSLAQAIERLRS